MWYRVALERIKNLSNGMEIRVQADGNLWAIVADNPSTDPAITVLGTGYSTRQTAIDGMNALFGERSIPLQPIGPVN